MGGTKRQLEEYYAWLQKEEESESDARYEEAQSRLRLSCACKDLVRDLAYPLTNRIVEMASFILQVGNCC